MARPIFTELAFFLVPFVVYAVFLWASRAGVFDQSAWSPTRLAWLLIAALSLMVGSFLMLAEFGGAPPGSTYVPAHLSNGTVSPGQTTGQTK